MLKPKTIGMVAIAVAAAACNSLTGLDEVTSHRSSGSGKDEPALVAADGVTITALTLYQGMRRPLMEAGAPATSEVPVVAGRQALLRVFYEVDAASFNGEEVTARLTIDDGAPIEVAATPKGTSSEGMLSSTINFDIPGELLLPTSAYRVALLQPRESASGDNLAATYPAAGAAAQVPLVAKSVGDNIKVVLIPIQYNADGSGRLPDISEQQIKTYRDFFYKYYPVPNVDVKVLATFPWNGQVSPLGNGWGELLQAITDFRQSSGAAPDEYYYGLFRAADSFSEFCNGGCIAGLSGLAGPGDPHARAGIGVGFGGPGSAETAVHEVGHQHGRDHAPGCGAQGVDPQFPRADGSIGDWGYDLVDGTLVQPSTADFMSYCDPTWVSDYNFKALFERISIVNGASNADIYRPQPFVAAQRFERITVGPHGAAQWRQPATLRYPPMAQQVTVTLETAAGVLQLGGNFYRYSHLPGGYLLFPKAVAGAAGAVRFTVDGVDYRVARP